MRNYSKQPLYRIPQFPSPAPFYRGGLPQWELCSASQLPIASIRYPFVGPQLACQPVSSQCQRPSMARVPAICAISGTVKFLSFISGSSFLALLSLRSPPFSFSTTLGDLQTG